MAKHLNKNPDTRFLEYLTDDFGVWEHCTDHEINKKEGYALDDSSRALIVYLLYGKYDKAEVCLRYIENSYKDGSFFLEFTPDRKPDKFKGSNDAIGLAFWALAFAKKNGFEVERVNTLIGMLDLESPLQGGYIRTFSYFLIGHSLNGNEEKARELAENILNRFNSAKNWYEDKLFYANAIIPYSLLTYVNSFGVKNPEIEQQVVRSVEILERDMRIGVIPAPPGNRRWKDVGGDQTDIYGQQPIDAGFMVLLLSEAYKFFKDEAYLERAGEWMDWFYGNNIMQESLVSDKYACADGIDEQKINPNRGSESTIMYLWASKIFQQLTNN